MNFFICFFFEDFYYKRPNVHNFAIIGTYPLALSANILVNPLRDPFEVREAFSELSRSFQQPLQTEVAFLSL